jgi:hypothetical protein
VNWKEKMNTFNKIKRVFTEEKKYLCRHPNCHKKFYTKEEMLKHYYPIHEGTTYNSEKEIEDIERYRKGIGRAERKIAIEKERKSYEIPGVDEVYIHSKTKYLRPKNKEELSRPTTDICLKCGSILYNTMLDGVHFYCPTCKEQRKLFDNSYVEYEYEKCPPLKVDQSRLEKERNIYKARLLNGEDEKSARAGLKIFNTLTVNRTNYNCKECSSMLFDFEHDGLHYQCIHCDIRWLKKNKQTKS